MSIIEATRDAVGTWRLDPVHSSVGFEVPYLIGTFKGQFRTAAATLVVDEAGSRLEGSAPVASVDVKDENLAAHLLSPEFFDAERHPELRFAAKDVALESTPLSFTGELTIKGVTREIELTGAFSAPIVDAFGQERIGLELETTVDRTDFGINWNVPLPSGEQALANEVTIRAELYLVKEA